jgi:hypothetical protein
MCEVIKEHQSIAVQELALTKELLQEQMLLKKAQAEDQLKMKEEKHQFELQCKKQHLQMNKAILASRVSSPEDVFCKCTKIKPLN